MSEKLTDNVQKINLYIIVAMVALLGYIVLRNSSAASTAPVDLIISSQKIYPVDQVTQMERDSITVQIVNHEKTTIQISPGLQMQVVDSNGGSHPMTAQYSPPGQIIGGSLAPQKTWTQTIDFNLSAGEIPSKLIYQYSPQLQPIELSL